MQNFTFHNPTKIIFGRGMEHHVGDETAKLGKRILLHYGGGSIKKIGLYDTVKAYLEDKNLEIIELGGVKPNPRLSLVRKGIELCRKKQIDGILAVGGGSVIDSAKAIAAGVPYDGDVWDFYTGKAAPQEMLPIGVVLTIPAAGSESSNGSVVTDEENNAKYDFNAEIARPKFAILNPENTFSLPEYQTACGAADIMAHVMERYFTQEPNVAMSDRLAEAVLKTMIEQVPRVLANPQDYEARAEIMWAGTLAHNDLLGRGRVEDWSSHMIEHELSAQYDVAHGAGLAVVFPAWMKYVLHENIERFVQFAVRVWNVSFTAGDQELTALEGIRRLEEFFASIGMPIRLEELGITDNRYEEMAEQAARYGSVGQFKTLYKEDIIEIFKLAEEG